MLHRRDFLKLSASAGAAGLAGSMNVWGSRQAETTGFFGVHNFIRNNPEAVFIMKTSVDVKTNAEAKINAGKVFSQNVFVPLSQEDGGIPLSNRVAIKPNLTWTSKDDKRATVESCRGIVTDPDFV